MILKDIRAGLRTFLLADVAIAAVVTARVYPVRLPQGIKDASIVYSRISAQGDHHMQGPSGLARVRMQIDCYAQTAAAANSLANLVKEAIDGHSGSMGSVPVQGVFFESERDLPFDDVSGMYGVSRDYFITYEER